MSENKNKWYRFTNDLTALTVLYSTITSHFLGFDVPNWLIASFFISLSVVYGTNAYKKYMSGD